MNSPFSFLLTLNYPDVDHSISSITLQRVQLQVPLEVPGVQSRDGQAVPVTSLTNRKQSSPLHPHVTIRRPCDTIESSGKSE